MTTDVTRRTRSSGLGVEELSELYAAHRLSLVRLALLLVDDLASAEDVVQDVFAAVASRREPLRDRAAALGYLRTAVVNRSRSALRRRRTARAYVPPHEAEPDAPDALAVLAEEHREVLAALGSARAPAARGAGAALLVGPLRGRDRDHARDLPRHRQVHREPGARRARVGPAARGGNPMSTHIEERLVAALAARAEQVQPDVLRAAPAPPRPPPLTAGLVSCPCGCVDVVRWPRPWWPQPRRLRSPHRSSTTP